MKTSCILFTAPGSARVSETELPALAQDEILVATAYSCISPGTELRCLSGKQSGAPSFPFIPGYTMAGVVIGAGKLSGWQEGDRVFASGTRMAAHARCWGGHCERAIVRGADALAVPTGLHLRAASTAKLAAIAYHGLVLAGPLPHETVAVVGLGPIGRFAAECYRLAGAQVWVTDLSPKRRAQAHSAGFNVVHPEPDLLSAFGQVLPLGADIVVDATGAAAALAQTVQLGRCPPWDQQLHTPTRFVMQGSYGSPPAFPYDPAFDRELHLLVPRDNRRADILAVLDLMARGSLDPLPWLEELPTPDQAIGFYSRLQSPEAPLTGTISWQSKTEI